MHTITQLAWIARCLFVAGSLGTSLGIITHQLLTWRTPS